MPSALPAPVDAYALILAGGGGTRLWPSSRRSRPKQLLALGGKESLLRASFRRAQALFGTARTLIVTAADQADAIRAELPELPAENVIAEPAARNTAAAVGLGAAAVARRAGEAAVLAVLPSDAFIGDEAGFARTVATAVAEARGTIVTIGIKPTHPETGFGYLHLGAERGPGVFDVGAFVEKPNLEKARQYLAAGTYLWNSGMFFFTAGRMLAEAKRHMPALGEALASFVGAPDFDQAVNATYPSVPATSIDYGIMEKTEGIRVVPGDFGWNDVGSWAALGAIRPTDPAGNVVSGEAVVADSAGNIVISEAGAPLVGVVGVEDLVVVATKDAVLVVKKKDAQDVKKIVEELKARGRTDLL
ncbi:MAG TPA: mannose-1-phosphate guanylyltransferase [Polyangia bacterium]